jgi:hypothetical protein
MPGQAAADHKVAKQDRKIHELLHGKEKKDNWWHLCLLPVSMHSHILHVLSSELGCAPKTYTLIARWDFGSKASSKEQRGKPGA